MNPGALGAAAFGRGSGETHGFYAGSFVASEGWLPARCIKSCLSDFSHSQTYCCKRNDRFEKYTMKRQ